MKPTPTKRPSSPASARISAMNVLFVCTLNVARSVAAERLYRGTPGMSVRSAGISSRARRTVSAGDVAWADRIIIFEDAHRRFLERSFGVEVLERVVDVGVDDEFTARSPALLGELQEALLDILGPPGRRSGP